MDFSWWPGSNAAIPGSLNIVMHFWLIRRYREGKENSNMFVAREDMSYHLNRLVSRGHSQMQQLCPQWLKPQILAMPPREKNARSTIGHAWRLPVCILKTKWRDWSHCPYAHVFRRTIVLLHGSLLWKKEQWLQQCKKQHRTSQAHFFLQVKQITNNATKKTEARN